MTQTLEDVLLARGETIEPGQFCDCFGCGVEVAYFAMIDVTGDARFGVPDFVCSSCFLDIIDPPAPVDPPAPWDGDLGTSLKGQRSIQLDRMRWTVMPDSPLADPSKAAWLAYLQQLHRMTIDCPDPVDWQWPVPPPIEYPDPAQ